MADVQTDIPDSPLYRGLLEHLLAIRKEQAEQARVLAEVRTTQTTQGRMLADFRTETRRQLADVKERLNSVESGVARLHLDVVQINARLDGMDERILHLEDRERLIGGSPQ